MKINLNWGGLHTSFQGIQNLLNLYHIIMNSSDNINKIDMSRIIWIDANMCAPFGALLTSYIYSPQHKGKQLLLLNINENVEDILTKNGFLSDFCNEPRKPDIFQTTIEYRKFEDLDPIPIKDYVERYFIRKHMATHIPSMSTPLQKKFRGSIFEIFENAIHHSETQKGIFACGQYFPKKNLLRFSIADLGIGFRNNIYKHLKIDFSPEGAISWAVDGSHTTRLPDEGIPGGLGLKLIKNFICVNGGEITIVSDGGYWKFENGKEKLERLRIPFPGTLVNITINTLGEWESEQPYGIDPKKIF